MKLRITWVKGWRGWGQDVWPSDSARHGHVDLNVTELNGAVHIGQSDAPVHGGLAMFVQSGEVWVEAPPMSLDDERLTRGGAPSTERFTPFNPRNHPIGLIDGRLVVRGTAPVHAVSSAGIPKTISFFVDHPETWTRTIRVEGLSSTPQAPSGLGLFHHPALGATRWNLHDIAKNAWARLQDFDLPDIAVAAEAVRVVDAVRVASAFLRPGPVLVQAENFVSAASWPAERTTSLEGEEIVVGGALYRRTQRPGDGEDTSGAWVPFSRLVELTSGVQGPSSWYSLVDTTNGRRVHSLGRMGRHLIVEALVDVMGAMSTLDAATVADSVTALSRTLETSGLAAGSS